MGHELAQSTALKDIQFRAETREMFLSVKLEKLEDSKEGVTEEELASTR